MMIVIPIIVLVILTLFSFLMKVDIVSKKIIITYSAIMCILIFISMFNPVDLYNVSNYTYTLLITNVICVAISMLIVSKKLTKNKEYTKKEVIDYNSIIKSKVVCTIQIIETVILIYYLIKYINIISEIPKSQIRIARFTLLFDSAFETLFYNYIVSGIITITSLIYSILLVNKRIFNIPFAIMTINIILFTIIGFGRMTIFFIIIAVFLAILIIKNIKEMLKIRNIIKILIVIIIIFVCFSAIVFIRMNDSEKTIKENIVEAVNNQCNQIFEYFLGGIRMLDKFVKNGFPEFSGYTYGRATLAGIDEIVLYPFKGIGMEWNSFNNLAADIMSRPYDIGHNTPYYNAFYTGIMNFYLDFGIIGVVVFSILHGSLIAVSINQYRKHNSIYSLTLLLFVLSNLILTILRWGYQSGNTMFTLIVLILINVIVNYKERNKTKNENIMDC